MLTVSNIPLEHHEKHAALPGKRSTRPRKSITLAVTPDRGEGVVCNNVIHDRSGFGDSPQPSQRLLYRARYRERIIDTGYTTLLRRHSETG